MINIPSTPATRVGLNVSILLGAVVALRLGQSLFIPTIIALLQAAVLGPAAIWLHRRLRVPWTLSCLSAISLLVALNVLVMSVFALAIPRMLQVLPRPDDTQAIISAYKKFRDKMERISPVELDPELFPQDPVNLSQIQAFQNLTDFARSVAPDMLRQTFIYSSSWLWQWVLILFILFFLLLEGGMLTRRVVEIFGPSQEIQDKARTVLNDMAHQVKTYLVWRTIINFGLGLVVGTVYYLAGLDQPWTWAMLLAILNYIPYLGPLIAGIPPLADALLTISPLGALVVACIYTVVIVLEGYLIVPVLMGRSMDLNATTVLLACLFWELVWGTTGLFLAMPLMAALKAICFHVPGWRPWANLMSTGEHDSAPDIPPPDDKVIVNTGIMVAPQIPLPAPGTSASPAPVVDVMMKSRLGTIAFALGAIVTCILVWVLAVVFSKF